MSTPLTPDSLATWAGAQGWTVHRNESLPGQLLIQGAFGSQIPVRAAFFSEPTVVWLQVELSQVVPPEQFREVSFALALLNASTFMGGWNLKTSTGKVNFRVALPTGEIPYPPAALLFSFQLVLATVTQSGPRLTQVLLGKLPAEQVRAQ